MTVEKFDFQIEKEVPVCSRLSLCEHYPLTERRSDDAAGQIRALSTVCNTIA